jgi:hypothetical protein
MLDRGGQDSEATGARLYHTTARKLKYDARGQVRFVSSWRSAFGIGNLKSEVI